jgi:chromosome partitioning protein
MRRPILNSFVAQASAVPPLNPKAAAIINAHRAAGVIVGVVANGKGGCGKSTVLMNTAIGYGWEGKKVLIIDADLEQLTAGKWPRPEGSENPTIITRPTAEIIGTLARFIEGYDIVLIDLPGRDDLAIASVLEVADILISPSKPSHQDLSELDRFIRVAKARGVPHVVVFNEATRELTGELARLREEFSRFAPFLPVAIQQLSAYRRVYAHGRGVLDISGAHPAKQNFERVFEKLAQVIAEAHAQRVAVLS